MDKNALWKWLILIVLVSGSIALVTPPSEKIPLGLDLKGGSSFTVSIDEQQIRDDIRAKDEAMAAEQVEAEVRKTLDGAQSRALEVLRNRVDSLGIAEPIIYPTKDNRIIIQLPGIDAAKRKDAEKAITSAAFLEFRMVHKRNSEMVDQLFAKDLAPEGYRIVRLSKGTYYARDLSVPDTAIDEVFRARLGKWQTPEADYEFMLEKVEEDNQKVFRPCYVKRRADLTGEVLKSAAVDYQTMGTPVVDLAFDSKGAKIFANLTADYAPGGAKNPNQDKYRQLAIVLDKTLYSAPRINEPIPSGRAEISGSFSVPEAMLLANILNAGSLPAPVKIIERRTVDPSLGADSISSGIKAGVYGCVAILVLMAAYYLMSGLLANVALLLNVILLPLGAVTVAGFLGMLFGGLQGSKGVSLPVLTLPGIAGIALAIGMAVDANVLIFERMREELRAGKGYKAAVDAGFTRAFTAIFDSNMTTIITAVIMFAVGTGAVRGYAITLTAGLLINLYTSVLVTRMCFDAIGSRTADTKWLKMLSIIRETKIDFIGLWKYALTVSIVLIVVSWSLMISHGLKDRTTVLGVDFTGGTSLALSFDQKPSVEDIRSTLDAGGVRDSMIQYQGAMEGGSKEVLLVKVATMGEADQGVKALTEKFPQANFKVMQQDDVGPQVGRELKKKGFWALALAMIAMVIYIGIRFEFGFGLGAVVATVHDAAMVIGVCHLFGFQLNMTIMAAVLTIIGYSVNDTIVIFDRIRENLRLVRNQSFKDICNLSVNQTLARTLLTNFYTFISILFLLFMGGGAIKDFSFAMFVGMIAGTYSTVYIATPIVLMWYRFKTPDLGSKSIVK